MLPPGELRCICVGVRRHDGRSVQPRVPEHIVQRRSSNPRERGAVRTDEGRQVRPAIARLRRLSGGRSRARRGDVLRTSALRSQNA